MLDNICNTSPIHVWGGVRLVANYQSVFALVIELPSRAPAFQQRISQVLQYAYKFIPLYVGWRWFCA